VIIFIKFSPNNSKLQLKKQFEIKSTYVTNDTAEKSTVKPLSIVPTRTAFTQVSSPSLVPVKPVQITSLELLFSHINRLFFSAPSEMRGRGFTVLKTTLIDTL
jgi:hypothetical protein